MVQNHREPLSDQNGYSPKNKYLNTQKRLLSGQGTFLVKDLGT